MDEYRDDNLENDKNEESGSAEYASDYSNTQKSSQEDKSGPQAKEENNGSEEADAFYEENGDSAQAVYDGEELDGSDEIGTASYVWSSGEDNVYSVSPESVAVGAKRSLKRERTTYVNNQKRGGAGFLFWLIPLVVVASLSMGLFAGMMFSDKVLQKDAEPDFVDTSVVTMDKNEAAVSVEVVIDNTSKKSLSVAEVAEMVSDAVVEVSTSSVVKDAFFGNYIVSGAGSGVVIAQTGEYAYVVTNYHVIEGATEIAVTATDGTTYIAEYLDGDAAMDIAMLRIKASREFPKVVCGSSSAMRVGEEVVAIGNPLGELGGTVTNGIISALDRRIEVDGTEMVLMQTNAAVNPGNSGGGLFNMAGELIAIVNAKEAATGVEGLGFAIPIDRVYDTLVEIIENKYIHGRPTLDIEVIYVSELWEAIRKYGVNTTGIFVTDSHNDEIEINDIINSINGELITDEASYAAAINDLEVGDIVTVELYRASNDGRWYKQTVEVEVKEYVPNGIFG